MREYGKGDLDSMQKKLRDSGELISFDSVSNGTEAVALRALVTAGIRVIPNHFVGKYQFDAVIADKPILLEVDGGIHRTAEKHMRDCLKDRAAVIAGYRVLRFSTDEDVEVIVDDVRRAMANLQVRPRVVLVLFPRVRDYFLRLWDWIKN